MIKKLLLVMLTLGIITTFLVSFSSPSTTSKGSETKQKPKRIILMMIDGLGTGQVHAARVKNGGKLNFDEFKSIGMHCPSSSVGYTADQFATPTQLACGVNTKNGYSGVNEDGEAVENLFEIASKNGFGGAIITTGTVADPTLASFLIHSKTPSDRYGVVQKMSDAPIDFLMGGGRHYFMNREDGNDITNWFRVKGFKYYSKMKNNPKRISSDKVLALTHDHALKSAEDGRGDYLQQAWLSSFHHYAKQGSNYFTLIHNPQVHYANIVKDDRQVIQEVLDIDKTLGQIFTYIKPSGGILLIVTGTYDSGGMTVMESNANGEPLIQWSAKTSTNNPVPVYAYGLGAEEFMGTYQSTEFFNRMKSLLEK